MTRDDFDKILDKVAEEATNGIFDRMNALMQHNRSMKTEDIIAEAAADTVRTSVRTAGRLLDELGLLQLDA